MRGRHFASMAIIAVFPGLLCSRADAEPKSPAEIFEVIRAQFEQLHTIDVSSSYVRIGGETKPDASAKLEDLRVQFAQSSFFGFQQSHFWQKGERFRGDVDDNLGSREYAFDGNRYQQMDRTWRMLRVDRDDKVFSMLNGGGHGTLIAVIRPYDFAFFATSETPSIEKLRSPETWSTLTAFSEMRGEEEIDGHPCQVVEIVNPNHPRNGIDRTRVYFATDLDFYPIRYEHLIGNDPYETFHAMDVSEAARVKCPDGACLHFFAGRSVLETFDWMGSGRLVLTTLYDVDVESMRINFAIPDEFFTIARSEALTVYGEARDE